MLVLIALQLGNRRLDQGTACNQQIIVSAGVHAARLVVEVIRSWCQLVGFLFQMANV